MILETFDEICIVEVVRRRKKTMLIYLDIYVMKPSWPNGEKKRLN